jgi:hypothetical protein
VGRNEEDVYKIGWWIYLCLYKLEMGNCIPESGRIANSSSSVWIWA